MGSTDRFQQTLERIGFQSKLAKVEGQIFPVQDSQDDLLTKRAWAR